MSRERESDVVPMTGHAFQLLLGHDEVRTAPTAVRAALREGGRSGSETQGPHTRAGESRTTDTPVGVASPGAAGDPGGALPMDRQLRSA
ncbi:hypothetical protein OG875_07995 [Streptomyces sp. NBC_01498]|uniref:hypothetical protein n=1 Tax=Streptomyces sp. NBC_01498 TaxID=2975870 RepID=UPI002E7ADD89|nr:hypothetical protein [Streptomyces sp. NBC_01498]WTL24545.1 hypothetical protein OG875_07995 [Streptomyces sp. NBC_01498]